MKALILNSIVIIGMMMITGSCEKNEVAPCVKGVLVESVSNCYLIIQVLNAPIGKSFTHKRPYPSTDPSTTYSNAVVTTLTINANYLDTIYFRYDKQVKFDCTFGNGLANPNAVRPPDVPSIRILNYSKVKCP